MTATTTNSPLLPAISVYAGGVVIGLTLVSFPASSATLKAMHGFSDAQYGAIYLPQLLAAVVGAVGGGLVTERLGMKTLYLVALLAFAGAQLLLALSAGAESDTALLMIMAATACFGFGFGFGGGPLNAYAALLFPARSNTALTALHMCAGAGLTIGPALFAGLAADGRWLAGPLGLLAVTVTLLVISLVARFPADPVAAPAAVADAAAATPARSGFFWLCALVALVYSVAEGTFSNWAILYLQDERGQPAQAAALALTCFWAALTLGRLLASILVVRLPPTAFLVGLPLVMALAFLLLPGIETRDGALAGFALAGLGCSAFFPMLVAFAAGRFPASVSWIASMLTAAMMVGVGIGSYAVGALRGDRSIAQLYDVSIAWPLAALGLILLARRIGVLRVA